MKKNTLFLFLFVGILCSTPLTLKSQFITDPAYMQSVEEQFARQKKLAERRDAALFDVFKQPLTREESEALKFLYAYMPLSDLADYSGQFFLDQVRWAFQAREAFAWTKSIPGDIYRHFVLVPRINNENMDTARGVFFKELLPRVKNLSMKAAILEVNHWCHEKVIYKGTDSRTSAPLSTVQTAYGRCGEESTFTVTALRAVGIPARQCYTPRWAHTDDNHAWVEVWAEGRWYFLGACEPEYDLNLAWFTGPAYRAMLVGTNVYGDYRGPEEVLFRNEYYTRINLIANYAPVKTFFVQVVDERGQACDSAEVEFCIYNYAEFYPVARKYTGKDGFSQLTTGLGDMMVWVNNGTKFGYQLVTVEQTDTVTIRMDKTVADLKTLDLDITPPVERPVKNADQPALQEENQRRLLQEDAIRNAYVATFADSLYAVRLAADCGMQSDSVWTLINKSEGNWRQIERVLRSVTPVTKAFAMPMLYALAEKDLRDVPAEYLLEHLQEGAKLRQQGTDISFNDFILYVMNPRIALELIRPYRRDIQSALGADWARAKSVNDLVQWINTNITVNRVANYYNVAMTPAGTFGLRVANPHSRDLVFVALCRTYGFPARIEMATQKPQYLSQGVWTDVYFEKPQLTSAPRGTVRLINGSDDPNFKPVYYTHYTLQIFRDGKFHTLDYEGSPEVETLPAELQLEAGRYMLMTGSRRHDGSVLSRMEFFDLAANAVQEVVIRLRHNPVEHKVLAVLDPGMTAEAVNGDKDAMRLVPRDKKAQLVMWMEPDKEPTRHVIAEILQLKESYDKTALPLLMLLNEKTQTAFDINKYKGMPQKTSYGLDKGSVHLKALETASGKSLAGNLPVIAVVNGKGEVVYLNAGYSIGTGEQVLKVLNALLLK